MLLAGRGKLPSTDAVELSDGDIADTACNGPTGPSLSDQAWNARLIAQATSLTGLRLATDLAMLSIMPGCADSTAAQLHGHSTNSTAQHLPDIKDCAPEPTNGEHVAAWQDGRLLLESVSSASSVDAMLLGGAGLDGIIDSADSSVQSCSSDGWSSEFVRREDASVFTPKVSSIMHKTYSMHD